MNREFLYIKEAEMPNVTIDDNKYELLCEIQAKNGTVQSFFVKEGGTDVVVEIGKESAIKGLFSTEKDKLRQLFDYIEATISPKNGLITYEAESFPRQLNIAVEDGGRYPIIQSSELFPKKETFLSGLLSSLRPQLSLDKALREQIREHMVSCTHVTKDDLQHFAEENAADLPVVMPAENLPEGWAWEKWDDGSGHLTSPVGTCYFCYDRAPYYSAGGIEYKETADGPWDVFWSSMSDFMDHAESVVNEKYLDDTRRHFTRSNHD